MSPVENNKFQVQELDHWVRAEVNLDYESFSIVYALFIEYNLEGYVNLPLNLFNLDLHYSVL